MIDDIRRTMRRRMARVGDERGFTLVELLVVIAILAILAGVVVAAVGGIGDKGQGSACEMDKRTLRTAEEAYAAQNDGFYTEEAQLAPGFIAQESTLHNITFPLGTLDEDTTRPGLQSKAQYSIVSASARCP